MAFPTGWNYKRTITVTNNTGGTLTNYQVHIVLDTQTLITNGKLQSNGADLAASDSDSQTQINLWFDPDTINTTTTDVWVNIPSLTNGSYTIYLFYGNSGASMQSTITNTFIYGDDFSTNTAGNYTTSGGVVSVSGGSMTLTGVNAGNTTAVPTTQTDPASYIVNGKVAVGGTIGAGGDFIGGFLGFKTTATAADGYVSQFGTVGGVNRIDIERYGVAHLADTAITSSVNTYYPLSGTFVSGTISGQFNGGSSVSAVDSTYTSGKYGMRTYNTNGYYKYFRVRAYTATEPTTSVGGETPLGQVFNFMTTHTKFWGA